MTTFAQPGGGEAPAIQQQWQLIQLARAHAKTTPRSLQADPGPSELGTPCHRQLGYRTGGVAPVNETDPWPAMCGTGIHAQVAQLYRMRNLELDEERYLVEQPVTLPGGVTGTCDLFDTATGDVVDFKTCGAEAMKRVRKHGPGMQQKIQVNLYALGLQLAGYKPADVVLLFLPRSGLITGMHTWCAAYDYRLAVDALQRLRLIADFHEHLPGRWDLLPTADAHCEWCPWYKAGSEDLSAGCPGHQPGPLPGEKGASRD